jgi:hypothetical protein
MKSKITFAITFFIGFILCSAVMAYFPMMIVRECPHCKAHVVHDETLSGNTFNAKVFTDGKLEAKMLPDHPALVKCPFCKGLFWVEEAEKLGYEIGSAMVGINIDFLRRKNAVLVPLESDIILYLASNNLPKEKEIYLRLRLWWKANDAWRKVPNSNPTFSPEQVKNLMSLSALLDESLPEHRILKAEIARELGKFDDCLLLLSHQFDKDYVPAVVFIRNLAEEKVRGVKLFEPAQ